MPRGLRDRVCIVSRAGWPSPTRTPSSRWTVLWYVWPMKSSPPFVLLAITVLAACGKSNPPELNEAAQKAADAYCNCVKQALSRPRDKLAGACEAEKKAYDAAWEALPVRAQDPKAEPIFKYQHECYRMLSDAKMKAPPTN